MVRSMSSTVCKCVSRCEPVLNTYSIVRRRPCAWKNAWTECGLGLNMHKQRGGQIWLLRHCSSGILKSTHTCFCSDALPKGTEVALMCCSDWWSGKFWSAAWRSMVQVRTYSHACLLRLYFLCTTAGPIQKAGQRSVLLLASYAYRPNCWD